MQRRTPPRIHCHGHVWFFSKKRVCEVEVTQHGGNVEWSLVKACDRGSSESEWVFSHQLFQQTHITSLMLVTPFSLFPHISFPCFLSAVWQCFIQPFFSFIVFPFHFSSPSLATIGYIASQRRQLDHIF